MVVLVLRFKKRGADAGAFLGDLLGLRAGAEDPGAWGASTGICDGVAGPAVEEIGWDLCVDKDMFPIMVVIEMSLFGAILGVVGTFASSIERSLTVVDGEKDLSNLNAKEELAQSGMVRVWVSWLPLVFPISRLSEQPMGAEENGVLPIR